MTLVRMINSVGDQPAGVEVELDTETADRFIVLGYAEGELSRDYNVEELAEMHASHQTVTL